MRQRLWSPTQKERIHMPKMKSHSGAKKRFRFTGTGKLMHRQAGKMHLNEHKSSLRTRRLDGDAVLAPGDAAKAKKLLGKSA
jgi:large subunit ribosomal protein L35